MLSIIKQKFKEQRIGLFYYFLGLLAYSWMIMGLFPTMRKMDLQALYESYPKEILKFFGESGIESMSKIEGFLSLEFLSLFFILIVAFYVAATAGSIIAGAIEKKTMDFQLSQPISRTKLLLSETIMGLLGTFILVFLTSFSIWVLGKAYHVEIGEKGLLSFMIIATLFLWAIYGIALIFSSFLKSKIMVASTTLILMMTFYVFSSMTRMVEKLANYDKYSLFYLYDPQKNLESGTFNANHAIILLTIFVVGLLVSLLIFNKRDI
jgi:ABC-2 type transport system permease protein